MEGTLRAPAHVQAAPTTSRASARAVRLPDGARLVHIGPHKTGTTALQAALWDARPRLLAHGVRHVGPGRNPSRAARAVVGQKSPYGGSLPIRDWDALVREFRRAREPRAVVSSEFFAYANADAILRIVEELDPGRLHVAVTLRPLLRIIPSTWQQHVQGGMPTPLEEWVGGLLTPAGPSRSAFWNLQRHDALIRRWSDVVGVDRVVAVVVDDRDHAALLRAFETLLGVPEQTLRGVDDLSNRSLTLAEAEAVRAFNVAFKAEGLPRDLHARTMRFGAAQLMKRRSPGASEALARVPDRFVAQIEAIQLEIVANIRASGVPVIGDLSVLTSRSGAASSNGHGGGAGNGSGNGSGNGNGHGSDRASAKAIPADEGPTVPAEVAASMAMALLETTGAIRMTPYSKGPFRGAEPPEIGRVPTRRLAGALASRLWRSAVGRVVMRRATEPADDGAVEEVE